MGAEIRHIEAEIARLRASSTTAARQIIASVAEQDRLTPDLQGAIQAAETLHALEDLYAPYRPARRTRASISPASEGLGPLST